MENILKNSVGTVKGIGKATTEQFEKLGILTIEDLLYTFPYRHEDFRMKDLTETPHGERVTVEGRVESEPAVFYSGKNRSRMQVRLLVGHHLVKAVFFNQHYLKDRLITGMQINVTGAWDRGRQTITVNRLHTGEQTDFEPVYSLKGIMHQKTFRRYMRTVIDLTAQDIEETLPVEMMQAYKLPSIAQALEMVHFPTKAEDVKHARRRFVYEELLLFQLKIQGMKKLRKEQEKGLIIQYDLDLLKKFISTLPFELTNAQKRVVNELCAELKSPLRMNRLLQGDVGSGKTAVAAIALYAVVTAGFQGALMAPTEILAEQHAELLANWFEPFGVTVAFLAGSTKAKARRELLERLEAGDIDLLIGTHALIQPEVQFHKLGFVVTDEQHRFGVQQRRVLRDKGLNPDVLFMTATPIPRTLAITVFGEMDVSILDELPAGRKEIETHWLKEDSLIPVLQKMEKELRGGRQAYVICPLIEESDKLDVQNAVEVHAELSNYFGGRYTVGLMHGRLPSAEKDQVMREFSEGQLNILVSTTVVEVGVNVPNATFMLIYDATRFGLAQLHQLRGRVGRGSDQSYCVLLANPSTEEGKMRMQSMTETNDGFVLAEKDLELRGSGDIFGRKQSGMPEFKMADLVHDFKALSIAREDAERLLNSDTFWKNDEYATLRGRLEQSGALTDKRID
ncbi:MULTISPECIES: ATP-dependent DNA helicase RecG [unclassified Sporosarcina]|uniref:ATP-dependent DNA helicase RecG n=1 Tax=unclassified Sporosarcina TaxID=2647733 RepID=UPI000C1709DE|nr:MULTISPECIES: ATP-dependent DNA helicase RecG [unclassified Sporosarcina]PID00130.1 ATP-dependent DNA helicase RecG [Sporosarcina sp. P29]PID06812.1 ATP-dependent DNA helicase RecG [Sporosarcina sp. P30]PID10007.1 ATP-dependent DNA helicase RecG [Sporosarcina sp. P31]PID13586.1 ATP-dependent DNA helicase RecG [Sporosarcina sp. P32b]